MDKDKKKDNAYENDSDNITVFINREEYQTTQNSQITYEYDRKNYDNPYLRKQYSKEAFNGKKTTIDATGKVVHSSHKAAKNKYGKNASFHQAETDHIDPLENIHSRNKKNAFLSDEDLMEVANRKGNIQQLNKHDNASKGSNSEIKMGLKTKDPKRAINGMVKQTENDILLAGRTIKNIGKQTIAVAPAAAANAAIAMVAESAVVVKEIFNGNIEPDEAVERIVKVGAKSFVSGEAMGGVIIPQLTHLLQDSGKELLKKVGNSGQIGVVINAGVILAVHTSKLMQGEIDCAEFAKSIAKSGISLAATLAVNAVAGPVVGTIITVASSLIYSAAKTIIAANSSIKEQRDERLQFLEEFCKEIDISIQNKTKELAILFEKEQDKWIDIYMPIFDNINKGILEDDPQLLNDSVNEMLLLIDKKPVFENVNEFKCFMDSPTRKITI